VNCICGCGTQIRGAALLDLNLKAGEVALELIAWDRARALSSPVATAEVAAAIAGGAPRYQELIGLIHGDSEATATAVEEATAGAEQWLAHSRAERRAVHEVFAAVPKRRIRLSREEEARVDRRRPELSFSGARRPAVPAGPTGGAGRDLAAAPTALELELGSVLQAARDGGADFERLAVGWLGRLVANSPPPGLDELRWLLGRLEDARSGRIEEAEPTLRRFLAERE
jgi:hypothetical protein